MAGETNRKFRVFLRSGVTSDMPEPVLRAHFSQFGDILDVYIPKDVVTRQPRGFAYVSFDSEQGVEAAVSEHISGLNRCISNVFVRSWDVRPTTQ